MIQSIVRKELKKEREAMSLVSEAVDKETEQNEELIRRIKSPQDLRESVELLQEISEHLIKNANSSWTQEERDIWIDEIIKCQEGLKRFINKIDVGLG